MTDQFAVRASLQSNEELQNRIATREKYLPETTEASVAELQKRGHVFTEEELDVINQDIAAQRENAALPYNGFGGASGNHKKTVVFDLDAPAFYSRRAIWGFSIFCSTLFGSAMLAINLGKIKNYKGVFWTLLFGTAFTTAQILIGNTLTGSSSIAYLGGFVGGLCLDYFFWKQFIGNATFYRERPIWGPLIVALVLLGLFVLAIIFSPQ